MCFNNLSTTLNLGFSWFDLISFFHLSSLVHAIVKPTGEEVTRNMRISVNEIHTMAYLAICIARIALTIVDCLLQDALNIIDLTVWLPAYPQLSEIVCISI
jgi:hypothetical protein